MSNSGESAAAHRLARSPGRTAAERDGEPRRIWRARRRASMSLLPAIASEAEAGEADDQHGPGGGLCASPRGSVKTEIVGGAELGR